LARTKRSSVFCSSVSDEEKKVFINIDTISPAEVMVEDGTNSKEGIIAKLYGFINNLKPTLEGQLLVLPCSKVYHFVYSNFVNRNITYTW
jgi:hypothetical protein